MNKIETYNIKILSLKKTEKKIEQRGFSLVEVMVAMAVFGISAMGLAALQKVSMDAAVMGRERTAAVNLANYAMTWIQNEAAAQSYGTVLSAIKYPNLFKGKTYAGVWNILGADKNFRFDEYYSNETTDVHNKYCVDYMFNQYASTNAPGGKLDNLYIITIRVSWPKHGIYPATWKDCTARQGDLHPGTPAGDPYNQLFISRVITRDFSNKVEI